MKRDTLTRLQALRSAGASVALVTRLSDGVQALVDDAGVQGELPLEAGVRAEIARRMQSDASGMVDGALFVRVFNSPPRLVLVGAVHIAQAIIPIAAAVGFETVVIDPRTAFATGDRFPGATLLTDWPDRSMRQVKIDGRTAVITLTHDPKLDDPALKAAFASEAFFIGSLGSRKTHEARLKRLRAERVTEASLARIHAPVGLPLGGRRPAEIALSIVAQVIQALHAGAET